MDEELRLHFSEDGADPGRVAVLTGYLRDELRQLDVDDVSALSAGEPPPGSRAFDAFAVRGPVTVQVLNFEGNSSCEFALHDAADGRQVNVGSVPKGGGPVTLDPVGSTQVYLTSRYCQVRLSEK